MLGIRGVHHGKQFEALCAHQARLQGLLLVEHGSKVLHTRVRGRHQTIPIKSDLDFRLHRKDGATVFFDSKSFDKSYATFSLFTHHQLERAALYEQYAQTAGMLVHLRQADAVVYFSASWLERQGMGKRFDTRNGLHLGNARTFSYAPLFNRELLQKTFC